MADNEYINYVLSMYPKISVGFHSGYDIDIQQLKRMVDVIEFFTGQDWCDGYKNVELTPSFMHGWVSLRFSLFHITDIDIKRFCDVIQFASSFSVDPNNDGSLEVGVTIPNIYRRKT